jgi:bacteriorhodopsin
VVDGEKVTWIRYVTWFTTTPLLLLQLCRLVHARQSVVFGLIIGQPVHDRHRARRRAVAHAAQLGVVRDQLGGVRVHPPHARRRPHPRGRRPPRRVRRLFLRLRNVNLVTWLGYPIVWALGTKGLEVLSPASQTAGYVLLDIASKVGFGLLVVSGGRALEHSGTLAGLARRRNEQGGAAAGSPPHPSAGG